MFKGSKKYTLVVASVVGLAAVLVLGALGLRSGQAEAQGILSVPACQCSAPTSILNASTTIVHCMCGGASCVISQDSGPGKSANLMQCVK